MGKWGREEKKRERGCGLADMLGRVVYVIGFLLLGFLV